MTSDRKTPVFTVDTNILIDYPDIIPNGEDSTPVDPTIDTRGAHIVIPTTVVWELSKLKGELATDRGRAAREAIRRLRALVEGQDFTLEKVLKLDNPITLKHEGTLFSILPLTKEFVAELPFVTNGNSMDDQVLATALLAKKLANDAPVTLLTNDNALATDASIKGLQTNRYGYRYPPPYTGRRDLEVPFDLYHIWAKDKRIPLCKWQEFMPEAPRLIANEFIIMTPPPDCWTEHIKGFSNIGRYDAKAKAIVPLQYYYEFPEKVSNAGQAIYAEALCHPDIDAVVVMGPAGTGKTYMSTVYGLEAARRGDYFGVVVVPCRVEDNIGFLPGDLDEKLDPRVGPIKKSLQKYLIKNDPDVKRLIEKHQQGKKRDDYDDHSGNGREKKPEKSILKTLRDRVGILWDNWFDNVDIAHAGGLDFAYLVALHDEFQNQPPREARKLINRLGEGGKIIITGDTKQVDAPYVDEQNDGLTYARHRLMDYPMVAQVTFTADEIVRHPLVKLVAQRQAARHDSADNHE
jgi:PhoH-like ATPase